MRPGTNGRWVCAIAAAVVVATSTVAHAQQADRYAVLSAIGDELTVVTYRPSVGSNLDNNAHQAIALEDESLDRLAVRVASDVIAKSVRNATVAPIVLDDRRAIPHDVDVFESKPAIDELLRAVRPQVDAAGARYLVVIGKHRGDTRVQSNTGPIGAGKLAGLGFYLDRDHIAKSSATGARGRGFIAPYAYLTVSLIDAVDGSLIRFETVEMSTMIASARNEATTDPWATLEPAQKIRILNGLVRRGLEAAVPKVVAPSS